MSVTIWRCKRVSCIALGFLASSCVGGRLGARWDYASGASPGVYGGPEAHFYMPTSDQYPRNTWAGASALSMFGRGGFSGSVAPGIGYASGDPTWRGGVHGATLTAGLEFGRGGIGLQLSGCYGYLEGLYGQVCGRWSSKGWVGIDVGAGLNLEYVAEAVTLAIIGPFFLASMGEGSSD